jgi:hypothetical protein
MCLMAAFVPHRPNKYFHVTASNGIVSNSPYTPLAIITASPVASVRVLDTVRDADVVSLRSLRFPTPSMIERAIIMLTDHRLWGHASGPSSSGKTLPSFHPLLARPIARRSAPLGASISPFDPTQTSNLIASVAGCKPSP